jgi:hypothetical protein
MPSVTTFIRVTQNSKLKENLRDPTGNGFGRQTWVVGTPYEVSGKRTRSVQMRVVMNQTQFETELRKAPGRHSKTENRH